MNETRIHFLELIENKDWKTLKQELHHLEPLQVAEILESVSKTDQLLLFRLLPRQLAKSAFQIP